MQQRVTRGFTRSGIHGVLRSDDADDVTALVPTSAANGIGLRTITAPEGFDVAGAQWIAIDRPDGHTQTAAIFVPDGPGPFPVVIYLHGSSGLGTAQLQWLPRLAARATSCSRAATSGLRIQSPSCRAMGCRRATRRT